MEEIIYELTFWSGFSFRAIGVMGLGIFHLSHFKSHTVYLLAQS